MAEPNCKKCIHKAVCDNYEQWIGDITGFENIRATKCPYFQESGWISVEDRLPETRRSVLGWCPEYQNIYCLSQHEDGTWWFFSDGNIKCSEEVTHWMPLPKPPKEG